MTTALTQDPQTWVPFSSFPGEVWIQITFFPDLEVDSSCLSHVIMKKSQLGQKENCYVSHSNYGSPLDCDTLSLLTKERA